MGAAPFRLLQLDHVVLRVREPAAMEAFYCDVLGCNVERRVDAVGLVQLRAGNSLIDLVAVAGKHRAHGRRRAGRGRPQHGSPVPARRSVRPRRDRGLPARPTACASASSDVAMAPKAKGRRSTCSIRKAIWSSSRGRRMKCRSIRRRRALPRDTAPHCSLSLLSCPGEGGMPCQLRRSVASRMTRRSRTIPAEPLMPNAAPAPALSISVRRLALLLGGLAMFGPFSIDTIFPAFPPIGAQFGADKLAMQQTISVYLIAYAAMSIVHGPLSDAIGRRRVILGGLAVFTLASVGCALAHRPDDAAGVPRVAGPVVRRRPDRRPRGDPRRAARRRCAAADEPGVDDLRRGAGDRAGDRRLDPGLEPLAGDLLVPGGVLAGAAGVRPGARCRKRIRRMRACRWCRERLLRDYIAIVINPRFQRLAAASAFNFARAVAVHRLGAGVRARHPASSTSASSAGSSCR